MLTEAQVVKRLDDETKGVGLREWARRHKVSHTYVWQVLAGNLRPGAKIAKALGVERVVAYRETR